MYKSSHSFLLLLFIIAVALGACNDKSQPNQPNPVLLISFDGFRHDYLSMAETPNFDEFIAKGVKADGLIPVFPTKTFPNHYTIATGLYAENSGLIGNTMYDSTMGKWYRIRDRKAVENPKWYNGEPIWNTVEKKGLRAGTMFWVGSEAPIQNMRPTHWKPFDGSMAPRARIDTVVKWMSAPDGEKVNFATLYFEHVDKMGHRYGADSDSVRAAVKESDALLGYLKTQMQQANLWDSTNILIVSDHGMINQSAEKLIELDTLVNMENVQRIIRSPVTMIEPQKGQLETVYQALKTRQQNFRIYKKENLPERYRVKNSPRVFDLVLVADAGYTVVSETYKNDFLKSLPSGMHGYDPQSPHMQAIFMARGPAFKDDFTSAAFRNVHIYPLMTHLLGLEPAPNDGSLDSVRIILEKPFAN